MKKVYPAILKPVGEKEYAVYVPDLDIYTQGTDLTNAVEMTQDAIGMWACCEIDLNKKIPESRDLKSIKVSGDEIVALIDIDIDAYRRAHDNRTVKKNLTIPSWLNERAQEQNINFSQVLQEALLERIEK